MKMKKKEPDQNLLSGLLSLTAESRHEIMKEIWFHPVYGTHSGVNVYHDLITRHRSVTNRRMYEFLTSEEMLMKYPTIRKVIGMDISELKSCVIIMLMLGIPARETADISLTSTGYIRFVIEEYPDLL